MSSGKNSQSLAVQLALAFFQQITPENPVRGYDYFNNDKGLSLVGIHKQATFKDAKFILEERLASLINLDNADRVRALAPQILKAFLASGIDGIACTTSFSGLIDLLVLCTRFAINPQLSSKMVVNVGYGGSLNGPTLRLPAYAVPALELLKRFRELGLAPFTLRFFSAPNAAVLVNGYDENVVWANVLHNSAITKLFAEEFYPDLSQHIVFDFDVPYTGGLLALIYDLQGKLEAVISSRPCFTDLRQVMSAQQQTYQTGQSKYNNYTYMLMHIMFFLDVLFKNLHTSAYMSRTGINVEELIMLSIGGKPERFFNSGRKVAADLVQKHCGDDVVFPETSVQVISGVGDQPVYYAKDGELMFSGEVARELIADPRQWALATQSNPFLKADYAAIVTATGDPMQYCLWVQKVAELFDPIAILHGNSGVEALAREILFDRDPETVAIELLVDGAKNLVTETQIGRANLMGFEQTSHDALVQTMSAVL